MLVVARDIVRSSSEAADALSSINCPEISEFGYANKLVDVSCTHSIPHNCNEVYVYGNGVQSRATGTILRVDSGLYVQ